MEENLTEVVAHLALQLGVILIAAKVFGEIVERFLKQPAVLGELAAGVVIGPFALGGLELPLLGALFPSHGAEAVIPVSPELYSVGQIAAVILLFHTGLNTDLKAFLRFAPQASVVAVGGVIVPFAFGDVATVAFGYADSIFDPEALFIGTIMTATSVGITARVLDEIRRLDSPEGVTILGAAVVDDVLGILILTIVAGIGAAGTIQLSDVAVVGVKAIGFWLVLTIGGILVARRLVSGFDKLHSEGATLVLAFALALAAAAIAESFGLAMIIGAYSVGLALSQTDLPRRLDEPLSGLYHALVPVFFAVMGMMVNIPAMLGALGFGLVIVVLAILGKIIGSGVASYATGFSRMGSWRVGVGMVPRGEVGLIVAGIGVAEGIIPTSLFGVAILMTLATTVFAPILLVPAFKNNVPGLRRGQDLGSGTPTAARVD